jgi:hypothetical protein
MTDPLILITPGQQFLPEFFIHIAIPPRCDVQRKVVEASQRHP